MSAETLHGEVTKAVRALFGAEANPGAFVPGSTVIPLAQKTVPDDCLLSLVHAVLEFRTGLTQLGGELEALFSQIIERRTNSLFVNSGSSANLLALSSLRSEQLRRFGCEPLRDGDEVITVAACSPTTVGPIVQNRLLPVFVDIDRVTLNAAFEAVVGARTERTRAVVLAHALGNPFRADLLSEWCKAENVFLIEDCRDALGAKVNGKAAGSFGVYSTFSFDRVRQVSADGGGAVAARDARWGAITRSLRDMGCDCWCEPGKTDTCGRRFSWQFGDLPGGYDHQCTYSHLGYNLRAGELQAAVVLARLKQLQSIVEARRANFRTLQAGIKSSPVLSALYQPVEETPQGEAGWLGFPLYSDESVSRERLMQELQNRRIETKVFYAGDLRKQPGFRTASFRTHGSLENTGDVLYRLFWLPVHEGLTAEMIVYMLDQLEKAGTQVRR